MKKKMFSILALLLMTATGVWADDFTIATNEASHGSVVAKVNEEPVSSAAEGATVSLVVTPDPGYKLKSISGTYQTTDVDTLQNTGASVEGQFFKLEASDQNNPWNLKNNNIQISSVQGHKIDKVEFALSELGKKFKQENLLVTSGTATLDTNNDIITVEDVDSTYLKVEGEVKGGNTNCIANSVIITSVPYDVDLTISTTEENVTFTMPKGAVTITAEFELENYAVNLKEGTEDADNWTIDSDTKTMGDSVIANYNGDKKVKSVVATFAGEDSPIALVSTDGQKWKLDVMPAYAVTLEVAYKSEDTFTVNIENWMVGETANTPTVDGLEDNLEVTYDYKQKGAEDSTYSPDVPTEAGDYTVRATVAETDDYVGGVATADFTITPADITVKANSAGDAYWATFYSEKNNYQAPEGTEVYIVTLDGNKLTMTKIEDRIVPSGKAVVLKSTTGNLTMTKTEAEGTGDFTSNSLKGTTEEITGDGTIYVLNGGAKGAGFYQLSENGTLPANKAYLEYSGADAREFFLFDETTSISEELRVKSEEIATAPVYDLQGRRVNTPTKGLYIVNGKKVVVK